MFYTCNANLTTALLDAGYTKRYESVWILYMERLTLHQIQDIEFNLLIMFDKLCKKHHLSYQLAYGTLLGAVRHQGFIPWDDDIDLIMPYEDYLHLCDIINDFHMNGVIDHYRFADYHIQSTIPYHQPFLKLYDTRTTTTTTSLKPSLGFKEGVFIDIFYYNGMPDNPDERQAILDKAEAANNLLYFSTKKPQRWELNPLRKTFTSFIKQYRAAAKKSPQQWLKVYFDALADTTDSYTANIAFDIKTYCMSDHAYNMEKNLWQPTVPALFEGQEFPIPAHYDELLTCFYGDYMTPPPISEQIPLHEQGFFLI